MSFIVPVKRLKEVNLPNSPYEGDAGIDLCAAEEVVLAPGERTQIPTGLAFAIPLGYVGLIWDKSGVSHKGGLKTLGGVVDAGYRGEVMVGIINLSQQPYTFTKGQKVAQMLFQKVEQPVLQEVDDLGSTDRGEKGFGSSGK